MESPRVKWEYVRVIFLNIAQDQFSLSGVEAGTLAESQAINQHLTANKITGIVQCNQSASAPVSCCAS